MEFELNYLMYRLLESGPLSDIAQQMRERMEQADMLPRRHAYTGAAQRQSFGDWERAMRDLVPADYLRQLCDQARQRHSAHQQPQLLALGSYSLLDAPTSSRHTASTMCSRVQGRPLHSASGKQDLNVVLTRLRAETTGPCGHRAANNVSIPRSFLASRFNLQYYVMGHISPIFCVQFDRTNRYVFTGADDQLVKCWCVSDGRLLFGFRGCLGEIQDIDVNHENTLLAAGGGGSERLIRIWNISTGECVSVLRAHTAIVTLVRFLPYVSASCPDLRILASTSNDGSVCFWGWDVNSLRFDPNPTQYFERDNCNDRMAIQAMDCSPGGGYVAVGCTDSFVRIYEVNAGDSEPTRVFEGKRHEGNVDTIVWSHAGLRFASGSRRASKLTGSVTLWHYRNASWETRSIDIAPLDDTPTSSQPDTLQQRSTVLNVNMIAWSANDDRVVVSASDNTVRILDTNSLALLHTLRLQNEVLSISNLRTYPRLMVSAGYDGTVVIWDIYDYKVLCRFEIPPSIGADGKGMIHCMDISADGDRIVVVDSNGHFTVFGLDTIDKDSIPNSQFFPSDYRSVFRPPENPTLVYDEDTMLLPHQMVAPLLCDSFQIPYPWDVQKRVPGREFGNPEETGAQPICPWLTGRAIVPRLNDSTLANLFSQRLARCESETAYYQAEMKKIKQRAPLQLDEGTRTRRRRGQQSGRTSRNTRQTAEVVEAVPAVVPLDMESDYESSEESDWGAENNADTSTTNTALTTTTSSVRRKRNRRQRTRQQASEHEQSANDEESEEETSESEEELHDDESKDDAPVSQQKSTRRRQRVVTMSNDEASNSSATRRSRRKAAEAERRSVAAREASEAGTSAAVVRSSSTTSKSKPPLSKPSTPVKKNVAVRVDVIDKLRFSPWLQTVRPYRTPYLPQLKDEVVYFWRGHENYVKSLQELCRPDPFTKPDLDALPYNNFKLEEVEFCTVEKLDWVLRPDIGRQFVVTLRTHRPDGPRSMKVYYHDMDNVSEFIILRQLYDHMEKFDWAPGDQYYTIIDGSWYLGMIDAIDETVAFQSYTVSWRTPAHDPSGSQKDTAMLLCETENLVSFWELIPAQEVLEKRGLKDVEELEDGTSLNDDEKNTWQYWQTYDSKPGDWPENGQVDELYRLKTGIAQLMEHGIAESFLAPVDVHVYETYQNVVKFPIDLNTLLLRLDNGYYRRHKAVLHEVRYLELNARAFNLPSSKIVQCATKVTKGLVEFINDYRLNDIGVLFKNDVLLPPIYVATSPVPADETRDAPSATEECEPSPPYHTRRHKKEAFNWLEECDRILVDVAQHKCAEKFRTGDCVQDNFDFHFLSLSEIQSSLRLGKLMSPQAVRDEVNASLCKVKDSLDRKSKDVVNAGRLTSIFNERFDFVIKRYRKELSCGTGTGSRTLRSTRRGSNTPQFTAPMIDDSLGQTAGPSGQEPRLVDEMMSRQAAESSVLFDPEMDETDIPSTSRGLAVPAATERTVENSKRDLSESLIDEIWSTGDEHQISDQSADGSQDESDSDELYSDKVVEQPPKRARGSQPAPRVLRSRRSAPSALPSSSPSSDEEDASALIVEGISRRGRKRKMRVRD